MRTQRQYNTLVDRVANRLIAVLIIAYVTMLSIYLVSISPKFAALMRLSGTCILYLGIGAGFMLGFMLACLILGAALGMLYNLLIYGRLWK